MYISLESADGKHLANTFADDVPREGDDFNYMGTPGRVLEVQWVFEGTVHTTIRLNKSAETLT